MKRQVIGNIIKEKRIGLGLTQFDLAKYIGLTSPQYISNIERGVCGPSVEGLVKLAGLLKIDSYILIDLMVDEYKENLKSKFKRVKGSLGKC